MAYTSKKPPFNVQIVDPQEYIQKWGLLPVTSHAIYETSSKKFHPDGFFSEVIFGMVGSNDRLIKKGYIDLHTTVISPHIYKQLLSLKSYYQDILSGRQYAYFDKELKDFVKTTPTDPNGDTGYSFFLSHLFDIEFAETGSHIRHMKLELLKKYRDRLLMNQFIILPAGMRDVRTDDTGKTKTEDINKLYFALLSLTKAMPDNQEEGASKIFDAIRFQIQNKIQQIYIYISNLFDGKGGFAQSKYAARSIVYSARNVITAAPINKTTSPNAGDMLKIGEVEVPLFQAMKECQPLLVNKLTKIFFEQVFHSQLLDVPLINAGSNTLTVHQISTDTLKQFTTAEGIGRMIMNFREPTTQMKPVTIPVTDDKKAVCYLYMVYDTGKDVYIIRNVDEFYTNFTKSQNYSIDKLTNLLANLSKYNPNDILIGASASLAAFGMPIEPTDLDIMVSDSLWQTMRNDSDFIYNKETDTLKHKNGILDVGHGWKLSEREKSWLADRKMAGETFEEIKKSAIQIGPYFFLHPAVSLAHYRDMDRVKDQDKIEFLESIVPEPKYLRPLTYAEMFYIACYTALSNRYCTATRHPVLNLENISPFKLHVTTTEPSRHVTFRDPRGSFPPLELPNYPKIGDPIKASMSMHPATLDKFGGDHDGISNNNIPL